MRWLDFAEIQPTTTTTSSVAIEHLPNEVRQRNEK